MKTLSTIFAVASLCTGVSLCFAVPTDSLPSDPAAHIETGPPAIPALPAEIAEIISATPFVLDRGFAYDWRSERPTVKSGYILVLKVDSALVYPRQTAEPVLFVGNQTAEKINVGSGSGRLIVLVPAPLKADGSVDLDLAKAPVWFGEPGLPEQVDAAAIKLARETAERNGIVARPAAEVTAAIAKGGALKRFAEKNALLRSLAPTIRDQAPDEKELADALDLQGR